jgi:hypothetical protein
MEHPATDMYAWLVSGFHERAQALKLLIGMLDTFSNLSVGAFRDRRAGYILYEPLDSLEGNLTDMPVRVQIEYHYGYAKLEMGEGFPRRGCAVTMLTRLLEDSS